MSASTIAALSYGILVFAGGILGYVKSSSKISLISGVAGGILLLVSAFAQWQELSWGKPLAIAIAAILSLAFVGRLVKTQKFMPSGLLLLAGLAALAALLVPAV